VIPDWCEHIHFLEDQWSYIIGGSTYTSADQWSVCPVKTCGKPRPKPINPIDKKHNEFNEAVLETRRAWNEAGDKPRPEEKCLHLQKWKELNGMEWCGDCLQVLKRGGFKNPKKIEPLEVWNDERKICNKINEIIARLDQ